MKLHHLLKSKRGIALETAILFMIVIFSFCALLTSLTLTGHLRNKLDATSLKKEVEIQQIGEDFLASIKKQEDFNTVYQNYSCEITVNETNVKTLTVRKKNSDKVVLHVEAMLEGGSVKVSKWR